jgi:hypothetical protein
MGRSGLPDGPDPPEGSWQQAVLDEYSHLLYESRSLAGRDVAGKADDSAAAITEAVTLRVSQPRVDDMVFGQPRQDDLLEYLSRHLSATELSQRMLDLRIDLSPPDGELQTIHGGCIRGNDPDWHCSECGREWSGRRTDPEGLR